MVTFGQMESAANSSFRLIFTRSYRFALRHSECSCAVRARSIEEGIDPSPTLASSVTRAGEITEPSPRSQFEIFPREQ